MRTVCCRHEINKNFTFYEYGGGYNFMNASSSTGGPSGGYIFTYFNEGCTVVKVLSVDFEVHERDNTAEVEDPARHVKPYCSIWVKHNSAAASTACEHYFNEYCDQTTVYEDYTPEKCGELRTIQPQL
ncbi:hypothetical protein V5799_002909 [Amblyomma americanum]|uniref:Lipocalin n=1 Tax=Amblyomma americanum TaxID=6943 RepID=A0AAQ4DAG9_AMBAM